MARKQPFTPEQFKAIYSQVPRLTVDLVITNNANEVLLLKRTANGWVNQWHLPGGTVLFNETLVDTVKRIATEELGVEIHVGVLLGYIEYHSELKERGFGYSVAAVFACQITSGRPQMMTPGENPTYFGILPENMIVEQKQFLIRLAEDDR